MRSYRNIFSVRNEQYPVEHKHDTNWNVNFELFVYVFKSINAERQRA